jgi:hypothetical protein
MATNSKFIADIGFQTDSDLQIGGNTTIDGNATVSGNLTVNGTSLTVNATTTSVEDNMLELANANTSSDTLDIGIYGNYDDGLSDGGATEYTGLFRDASDSTWKLFDGLEVAPTTTVNTSGTGYALADLQVGDLTATTLTATNGLTGSSITYPTSDGTNGQVIKTNGSGTLSFGDIPAGYADSDVESYLSGGTGVTYSSGAISIGQAVATSDSPTFTDMTLSGTDSIKVPSGTTGQRNGTPVNGMFRYNTTNSEFEGYQNGAWGAIAGGDGGIGGMLQNSYTGDGSTVSFTLSSNPQTENNTQVYIDGVYQNKSTYSTSGTTLTFDTAPENSAEIEVIMFDQTTVDTGSVTTTAIADNAVTIDKLALSDGTAGQFIKTDGSGTMSFASVPAGYTDSDVGTYLSSNGYATQSTVVAAITDSAPATLDTLNELAAALGDDANFSTTVTNSIALKAPLASPSLTGTVDISYGDYQNSGALRIGADIGTNTSRTNSTRKIGIISAPHYTNGEDDISLLMIDSEDNNCLLSIGGTASAMNSPSGIAFVTSSDAAGTSTGSERLGINNVGETTIKRAGSGGSGVLKALNINHAGTSVNDGAKISFTAGASTEGAGISSTGQALNSADLRFYAGGDSEKMRITSAGSVGIGTTAPGRVLEVSHSANTHTPVLRLSGMSTSAYSGGLSWYSGYGPKETAEMHSTASGSQGGEWWLNVRNQNSNAQSKVMAVNNSGRLRLTGVSDGASGAFNVMGEVGNSYDAIQFYHNSTTLVGRIRTAASSTSYNTSSDYRLKENVVTDWDATTRLKQLKPSRFNFITDAGTTVDGFLAHEVSSVVPEAITGTKDAVDSEGNPDYQGIDQSKLVPLLVKTIQELEARITTLENA